tara:strand:- start:602 stop:1039 length:438 start_codon:yes stop_codon:yes gene_type:complete
MQKEFCPYEQALALKELGFDEECFNRFYTKPKSKMFRVDEKGRYYPIKNTSKKLYTMGKDFVLNDSNVILAPTFSQAFRWFREKHGLFVSPNIISYEDSPCLWFFEINSIILPLDTELGETNDYKTYEEAEFECLNKLIEIVKTK